MRVRIVCYEEVHAWILGKFALKLEENLKAMGVDADISKVPDPAADINHHIIYYDYNGKKNSIDTVFITHIDSLSKKELLQSQLIEAALGICMSEQSMLDLASLGINRSKLAYINPAHDGVIKPRPKVVGLTCRVQEDGRKREDFLTKLAYDIDPALFEFKIMGDGWDKQVALLTQKGFKVDYTDHFVYDKYIALIPTLDYYLYMGKDEGQMGFIDALAAGVETIVTAQGYHLDAKGGITYPFDSYDELKNVFDRLTKNRNDLINSVSDWNWRDYAKKHLEIWQYLLSREGKAVKPRSSVYSDGLNSLQEFAGNKVGNITNRNKYKYIINLWKGNLSHGYYMRRANFLKIYRAGGVNGVVKKIINKFKS